jgi:hypothetical protein
VELKKGETILTDASLHLPAACLRKAFSDRSGVPPEHFELYYSGKRLEGEAALRSWGVEKDAIIEVKMRGRGGGCVGAKEASSVKEAAMAAAVPQLAAGSAAEALQAVMGSSADSASTVRAAATEKATAAERMAAEKEVGKKAAADESLGIDLHIGGIPAGGSSNGSHGSDGGGGVGGVGSVGGVGGGSEVDTTTALRTGAIELHGGLTLEPVQASIAAIAHHPIHALCPQKLLQ